MEGYGSKFLYQKELAKIDNLATEGLLGTANSLAYRIHELERHFHSGARWFEAATVPAGETHIADSIGDGAGAFRTDAGNDDWGAWVQILGSSDTPVKTGMVKFDPHQFIIENSERAFTHFIQVTRGASGAAGFAAGTYTEFIYSATVQKDTSIIKMQSGRAPVESKLWARCKCPGQNTGWLDFYFGIHEYEG